MAMPTAPSRLVGAVDGERSGRRIPEPLRGAGGGTWLLNDERYSV